MHLATEYRHWDVVEYLKENPPENLFKIIVRKFGSNNKTVGFAFLYWLKNIVNNVIYLLSGSHNILPQKYNLSFIFY
jgi:hypothetical protein